MDLDRLYKSFELLGNWEDRFMLIIDLGKKIPTLDEVDKTETNRVQGCFSTVHMTLNITDEVKLVNTRDLKSLDFGLAGSSPALGTIFLINELFSGMDDAIVSLQIFM